MVGVLGATITALSSTTKSLPGTPFLSLSLSRSLSFPVLSWAETLNKWGKCTCNYDLWSLYAGSAGVFNDPGSRQEEEKGTDRGVNRYNHMAFICRYAYDEQVPLIRACRKCSRIQDIWISGFLLHYNIAVLVLVHILNWRCLSYTEGTVMHDVNIYGSLLLCRIFCNV